MKTARQLARIGEFYIQEAILTALEEYPNGRGLGEIANALALPDQAYNAVVTGQLHRLRDMDRVEQPRGSHTNWCLTASERERRLDQS